VPELDPDEYLNRDLKTTIRSGPIAKTAAALLEKARTWMARIAAIHGRISAMSTVGTRGKLAI